VFAATFCHRARNYFFCNSPCGTAGLRQRTGFGWQAKPMLEQTGAWSAASREQFTHASVHRLQFGGPLCTETSSGAPRGAISRSAANEAPAASKAAVAIAMVKSENRIRFTSPFLPLPNKTKQCEGRHPEAATSFPARVPSLSGPAKA
jgi:hypothetical protein